MSTHSTRRGFLRTSASALTAATLGAAGAAPFRLGVVKQIGADADGDIAKVRQFGFSTCQPSPADFSPESAKRLRAALEHHRVEGTAVVTVGPGEAVWDFLRGPSTIGVVPRNMRRARIDHFKRASDFAKITGIPALQVHCGFIPEFPGDPLYPETVAAIREAASHCRANGQKFLCETGQETPVTLLRAILDVGLDNVGVGLDTANLILYGKANPVDALDVLGRYVFAMHAKDGLYPTDPRKLGREVAIGEGKVDFSRVLGRLNELGYTGAVTIEREISGPRQATDIQKAKSYLEAIIAKLPQRS